MDKIVKEQHIVSLIVKEVVTILSENEKTELRDWLSESREHEEAYEQLKQMNIREEIACYWHLDAGEGWKKYKKVRDLGNNRKLRIWTVAAAVAVIVLSLGIFTLWQQQPETIEIAAALPGSSKAILVLSDGTKKDLADLKEENITKQEGTIVKNDGTLLEYKTETDSEISAQAVYHELQIPKGGEYQLMLSDGTRVWLDAQTRLKYPVQFVGRERVVYLEGEAYFEVTRDKEHPFRVITERQVSVEVLGTSFNVRAYQDEETIETVLEEGVVRMATDKQQIVLNPGQRAVYQIAGGQMQIGEADTQIYTSWRKGMFVFNDITVEAIMRDLTRWYDVEVFYSDERVKHQMFNGKVKRYDNIQGLLKAMELAGGVRFELNGRILIVSSAGNRP